MMAVFCGVAAMGGHLWPVWLDFKGGKGVATGAGILFAMNWMAGAIAVAVWLVVFVPFRYVSLASIFAAASLPIAQFMTREHLWGNKHWPITAFCLGAAMLVVYKHRENIQRLRKGEEKRFSFSRKTA